MRPRTDTLSINEGDISEIARYMAEQLCLGFRHHDNREREQAVEAFTNVDILQFPHIDEEAARQASVGYVDALWAKDAVEDSCRVDGKIDQDALDDADWSVVEAGFRDRASVVGIDPEYATLSTCGWRRHKTGVDYWTPLKKAQVLELRIALQDPDYPHKPRYGKSGYGPEAVRYELGVELHDKRQWEQARDVMVPYFERILRAHQSLEVADMSSPDVADTTSP